jgi:hypothetical protein
MHAAIATAGCDTAMFSMSIELIHSPPDLMTSLARSVRQTVLSNHEPPRRLAVARLLVTELVGDFQVDAVQRVPLRGLFGDLLLW